ncbi:MAG: tryptophan 7-halogenase [Planctomycetaceae bacterium]
MAKNRSGNQQLQFPVCGSDPSQAGSILGKRFDSSFRNGRLQADVLVMGSGFGGSLLSLVLAKRGFTVVMVDRQAHPRFTIGESSTPLADAELRRLAADYDLPELIPLTAWGLWKRCLPNLTCGRKRGFSYFGHRSDRPFHPEDQLLAAASLSDDVSDTQWLRSDVDQFVFELAVRNGVRSLVSGASQLTQTQTGWQLLAADDSGAEVLVPADFVVDATGGRNAVLSVLNIPDATSELLTHSSAVYAHFQNVVPMQTILTRHGISTQRHPFPCDAGALHQVLEDGWMWQLRFDDNSVSAGIVLRDSGQVENLSPEERWERQLKKYPLLAEQFADARVIRPGNELIATGRLQRLAARGAGTNWAALPNTIGFIDPLHSTGLAHTITGLRRLADILLSANECPSEGRKSLIGSVVGSALEEYSQCVIGELHQIDRLVAGCYEALPSFRLWSDWCMLYFAAVTSMERSDQTALSRTLLLADDVQFCSVLNEARVRLQIAKEQRASPEACAEFESWLAGAIRPWNRAGLLNPESAGMYADTAAPDISQEDWFRRMFEDR